MTKFFAFTFVLLTFSARAQTPQSYVVGYEAGSARWLNAPRTIEMSKGVTFTQADATLKTNAAVATLDTQQRLQNARSLGPVHLYDAQNDLRGAAGFVDFSRRTATVRDDVTLFVKPGPKTPKNGLGAQLTDPATLTCALVTYDYRRKIGRIPGPLTIRSKGRILTANSGIYDGQAQTVTLEGDVKGKNGDQTINAARAVISIKEGAESITIPVPTRGVFSVKDEPDEPTPTPSGGKNP